MRDVGFNAGAVQKPQIGLAPASSDDGMQMMQGKIKNASQARHINNHAYTMLFINPLLVSLRIVSDSCVAYFSISKHYCQ